MATKKKGKKVTKPAAPKKRRGVSPSKTTVRKRTKALAKGSGRKVSNSRFRGKGRSASQGKATPRKKKKVERKAPRKSSGKRSLPKRGPKAKPNPRLTQMQKSLAGPAVLARNLGLSASPAHKVNKDGSIDVQLRLGNFSAGKSALSEIGKFMAGFGRTAGPVRYRGVRLNTQLFMKPDIAKKDVAKPEQYLRMVGSLPSINAHYRKLSNAPTALASLQNTFRIAIENGWEVQYATINLRFDPDWT